MHCGRILAEGETEEIAVLHRTRSRQKHGKRSNPYSTGGLDKFQSVSAEFSAKREYIAKKTGAPKALVRFVHSKNGLIPVVVQRPREGDGKKYGSAGAAGASILGSVEKINGEKDRELRRKEEGNDINGVFENTSISGFDERRHILVMPWSRFLKITAYGFLGLIAMWVRSAVSRATALTVVMAVGSVMCMKKIILSAVSYFTTLFRNSRNPKTSQSAGGVEEIAEQKDVYKLSRRTRRSGLTVSAPNSPLRGDHVQPIEFSASASPKPKNIEPGHKHHQSKAKKFVRVVFTGNRPTKTEGPKSSDSFYKRTRPAMAKDASVGATVMIFTLLFLVFYGRLCAIFFTSAWWYLLPMLVEQTYKV